MASNEDRKDQQSNTHRIENPFIAFRRFADEKIGSALQQLIGLPSAVTKQLEGALPALDKIRHENSREREEAESIRDKFRKGFQNEPVIPDDQAPQDLIEELKRHREQHRKRWEHIKEAIQQGPDAAYPSSMSDNDRERARAAGYPDRNIPTRQREVQYSTILPNRPPNDFFKDLGIFEPNVLGPLGAALFSTLNTHLSSDTFLPYLLFSPYSPLFLSNRMFSTSDKHISDSFPYCDAFEDLMLASRGMDMVPTEERRRRCGFQPEFPARPHDIGLAVSWLSRLQKQGLLDGSRGADDQFDEDDGTELGMYKQFLSSAFPKAPPQINEEPSEAFKQVAITKKDEFDQEPTASNSGILSTLTRTESKKFPDGRVETKVVLIKRFADGGETRTETVHTNHEGTSQGNVENGQQTTKEDGKEEKKGWFWN